MKNKIYLVILFLAVVFYSCEKLHDLNQQKDPEIDLSSTYPISGEWWVRYYDDAELTSEVVPDTYFPLYTYNTSSDDGEEIWIWDMNTFWIYRIKCPVNMTNNTFAGDTLISTSDYEDDGDLVLYNIWLNVTNGKVIPNGGHSTSGVVSDSIYMELEFEDDPGTIYYATGVRRTGFLEDEH